MKKIEGLVKLLVSDCVENDLSVVSGYGVVEKKYENEKEVRDEMWGYVKDLRERKKKGEDVNVVFGLLEIVYGVWFIESVMGVMEWVGLFIDLREDGSWELIEKE